MRVIDLDLERRRRRGSRPAGPCEACGRPSVAGLCPACLTAYEALCCDSAWDHEACGLEETQG